VRWFGLSFLLFSNLLSYDAAMLAVLSNRIVMLLYSWLLLEWLTLVDKIMFII
jgi:hypothetical protein